MLNIKIVGGYKSVLVLLLILVVYCRVGWARAKKDSKASKSHKIPKRPKVSKASYNVLKYKYRIIKTYPHDRKSYTQGLFYHNGVLYEGTGLKGRSYIRKILLARNEIILQHDLHSKYFGEGVTVFGDKLVQLTWQSKVGFIYNKKTFKPIGKFEYPTKEGWGITYDGKWLIMSDGTSWLYYLNSKNFKIAKKQQVFDEKGPVNKLNELEFVEGKIFANVWPTDLIIIIEPKTGKVIGRLDLEGILEFKDYQVPVEVLNGIAYNQNNKHLLITGKLWPKIFEIKISPIQKK